MVNHTMIKYRSMFDKRFNDLIMTICPDAPNDQINEMYKIFMAGAFQMIETLGIMTDEVSDDDLMTELLEGFSVGLEHDLRNGNEYIRGSNDFNS